MVRWMNPQAAAADARRDRADLKLEFEDVFRNEALAGLKLATWGRLVSLAVIAVLVFFLMPIPILYYYSLYRTKNQNSGYS